MKRQNTLGFFSIQGLTMTPAFLFLTAVFLCGAVAGSLTGLLSVSHGLGYAPPGADMLSWYGVLVATMLWLVGVLAAGGLPLGGLLVSGLLAVRAFVLAFSVAVTAGDITASLRRFGLQAVVTVPCMLILATAALQAAQDRPRGMRFGYLYALSRYRGVLAECLALGAASTVLRFLP